MKEAEVAEMLVGQFAQHKLKRGGYSPDHPTFDFMGHGTTEIVIQFKGAGAEEIKTLAADYFNALGHAAVVKSQASGHSIALTTVRDEEKAYISKTIVERVFKKKKTGLASNKQRLIRLFMRRVIGINSDHYRHESFYCEEGRLKTLRIYQMSSTCLAKLQDPMNQELLRKEYPEAISVGFIGVLGEPTKSFIFRFQKPSK